MTDPLWKHSVYCAYRDGDPCTCKELPGERASDPKPARRIRKRDVLPRVAECVIVPGKTTGDTYSVSRHHVIPRSQGGDDVPENLVWVDGDGTRGLHGVLETHCTDGATGLTYPEAARALVEFVEARPPLLEYVNRKKYPGWLRDHYRVDPYVCPNCERPARFVTCDWCAGQCIRVGESPVGREDRLAAEGHA